MIFKILLTLHKLIRLCHLREVYSMKRDFAIIQSILLVLVMYVAFFLNNALGQYFTSEPLLSTIVLSFIIGDILSNGYKLFLGHPSSVKNFFLTILLSFFILQQFSIFLQYFIIFIAIEIDTYLISPLSRLFSIDNQLEIQSTTFDSYTNSFIIREKKGLLFSEYMLHFTCPLTALSRDDYKNFIELLKNYNGHIVQNNPGISFSLVTKGVRFLPNAKQQLLEDGIELNTFVKNHLIT